MAAGIKQDMTRRGIDQKGMDGDGGVLAPVLGNGIVAHHDGLSQVQHIQLHSVPPF